MRRSVLSEAQGKLRRGAIGEAAVRPSDVVLDPPRLNRPLRIAQGYEPALVETLVAEPAVETLDIAVLDRFPWPDETQRDPPLMRPLVEVLTSELRTVVAHQSVRQNLELVEEVREALGPE